MFNTEENEPSASVDGHCGWQINTRHGEPPSAVEYPSWQTHRGGAADHEESPGAPR